MWAEKGSFWLQKEPFYKAKGPLLHSDCISFAMQKGLLSTLEVVLRECKEALLEYEWGM